MGLLELNNVKRDVVYIPSIGPIIMRDVVPHLSDARRTRIGTLRKTHSLTIETQKEIQRLAQAGFILNHITKHIQGLCKVNGISVSEEKIAYACRKVKSTVKVPDAVQLLTLLGSY
ncbi:hypothetical protein BGX31_010787 [Mortierella sp. GBA43]|nr:hypothetical protein BGX31_010787 [Mortierella sp. GBA43]